MNLTNKLLILFTLTGISSADTVCQTSECKQTANLIENSIDEDVDPCEDFYEYSCGNWKRNHPITAATSLSGVSHFQELNMAMINNLINVLQNSSTSKDPKYIHPLINFYKGCVNTNTRDLNEQKDLNVIKTILKKVGGWPIIDDNWDENDFNVENALIELNKLLISKVMLSVEVMKDITNNSNKIVSITNPFSAAQIVDGIYRIPGHKPEHDVREGVKNFSDSYYAQNPYLSIAEAYKGEIISVTQFDQDMRSSQMLDMKLRQIYTPINNFNYIIKNYENYKIRAKDLSLYPGIDYRKIIDGILKSEGTHLNDNDIIFADKEYLKSLGHIMSTADKRFRSNSFEYRSNSYSAIANTIGVNVAVILSRFSSSKLMTLAGIPSVQALPTVCVSFASQMLPDLMGRHYMDKLFAKESIADMKGFISSLKEAFNELLNENKWMDSTTKANAIKKLNAVTEHIGFPDYSFNDTQLTEYHKQFANLSEKTFLSTMLTAISHQRSVNSRALRNPEPIGHWPSPAQAVMINAFYNPEVNGIFFPAGIAQFPFFQHTRPKTVNLGAIGMVISHELTHAFDNMGSLFDEKGNLHNWFGQSSRLVFNEKAECFVEQYNQFKYNVGTALPVALNGERTLGENIADNGGVRIAYRALELYKSRNAGKLSKLPSTPGSYSDEKLFFLSFANLWCANRPASSISNQIARDPHSIENARVIGTLANFPEFAKTFSCKIGSRMNPINKCVLWG